jgi:AAA+ superfamily predicted ATPase
MAAHGEEKSQREQEIHDVLELISTALSDLSFDEDQGPVERSNSIRSTVLDVCKNFSTALSEEEWRQVVKNSTKFLSDDMFSISSFDSDAFDALSKENLGQNFPEDATFLFAVLQAAIEATYRIKMALINKAKEEVEQDEKLAEIWNGFAAALNLIETPADQLRFVVSESLSANHRYTSSEKNFEQLAILRGHALDHVEALRDGLAAIHLDGAEYAPDLGNKSHHIVLNPRFPTLPSHGHPIWSKEALLAYHDLEEYDKENWIGKDQDSDTRTVTNTNAYSILYCDMMNFLSSLGYNILVETSTNEAVRSKPRFKSFEWNEKRFLVPSKIDLYLYNENCPLAGQPMRLVVSSRWDSSYNSGDITWLTGAAMFSNTTDEDQNKERSMDYIELYGEQFEIFERQQGLLKNSKFDTEFVEVNPRGRTFDDMVLPEVKVDLLNDNVFAVLKNIEKLKGHRVDTNRGIILAGPPGVGKSMTLDALMSASQSTVILAKTKAMHEELDWLFRIARKYAPTVLILEDMDALAISGQRGEYKHGAGLSGLLNALDGIESNDGVITIATTNHPELLDWALICRPGRFDVRLDYEYPPRETLKSILDIKLKPFSCHEDVNTGKVAAMFPERGFTGSHVHEIVKQAHYIIANASEEENLVIDQEALIKAVKRIKHDHEKGLAERRMDLTPKGSSRDPNFG